MKRILVPALSLVAFLFLAAPIYMNQPTQVFLNGKPFAKAQLINGQWAIPLEDFARAAGGTLTLPQAFQVQGNRLVVVAFGGGGGAGKVQSKIESKIEGSSAMNTIGGTTVDKTSPGAAGGIILQGGVFEVRKAGEISGNLLNSGGKLFIPLADVARAFGGTFTAPAGNLRPGASLSLNFTFNGNAILAAH